MSFPAPDPSSPPVLRPGQILILSPDELRSQSYWPASKRPIHGLLFVLPLVVLYEVASYLVNRGVFGQVNRVLAFDLLQEALQRVGATGLYLPGLAIVAIFLFWHISTREPWVVRRNTVALMWLESTLLAVPIYLLNRLFEQQAWLAAGEWLPMSVPGWRSLAGELTLSIGAGIYEELLFRLVLLAIMSLILVDVLNCPRVLAGVLAAVVSGLAFSLYHYLGPEHFRWGTFAFRAVAGVYLAGVFQLRGFGLAVGAHAMYDVIITVGMASSA